MKTFIQHLTENKKVPDSEDLEMKEVEKVAKANAEDLKEYPGKKGKHKHHKLHKVLKGMVDKMRKIHREYVKEDWEATIHYTDKDGKKGTEKVNDNNDIRVAVKRRYNEMKQEHGISLDRVDYH
jgi:hypothetical protein